MKNLEKTRNFETCLKKSRGLCVYHIVLLIPAALEFIMRDIPANIYSI